MRALTADTVVAVTEGHQIGSVVGQVGQLVKDHIRTERGQGLGEGSEIEHVAYNGLRAKLAEQAGFLG
jgi:hypothetical protein